MNKNAVKIKIVSGNSAQIASLIGFTKEQVYWLEAFARYLDGAEICSGDSIVKPGEFDVYHGSMMYDEFRDLMEEMGYGSEIEQADLESCVS